MGLGYALQYKYDSISTYLNLSILYPYIKYNLHAVFLGLYVPNTRKRFISWDYSQHLGVIELLYRIKRVCYENN